MLNTRPNVKDIIVFKLVSGEEVIARLVEDRGKEMRISKPISVGMAPDGRVAMVPFMVSLKDDCIVSINLNNVIIFNVARDEIRDAYIANTSGIAPASAADIVGLNVNDQGTSKVGPAVAGFNPNPK